MSYWLKSGVYTLLIRVSSMLFGLGGFVLLTRALSKADFGAWALFMMISGLIEVCRNGLIQNGLVKHIVGGKKEELDRIYTASMVLNALLSGGILLGLWVLAPWIGSILNAPELSWLLRVYMLTLVFMIPFSQSEYIHQANFDFRGTFFAYFIRLGTLFGFIFLSVIVWDKVPTLTELVWVHCGAALLGSIVLVFFSRKYFRFSKQIDWSWVKKLFNYGRFVFGTNVGAVLMGNIDSWMLSAILGDTVAAKGKEAVASYTAALRINQLVEVPTGALAAMVFPQSAKRIKEEGLAGAKYLYEKSVGTLLAIILPGIAFVLLVPEFLMTLLAGSEYIDSVPVLCVTILFGLFIPFTRQFGTILDSIGKPKINFYFVFSAAILNVILNYFFITSWGLIGAAYATLCTHIVTFIGTQILLKKELDVNTLSTFKYALKFYPETFAMLRKFLANRRAK